MKSYGVTIQLKVTEQYFPVVLFHNWELDLSTSTRLSTGSSTSFQFQFAGFTLITSQTNLILGASFFTGKEHEGVRSPEKFTGLKFKSRTFLWY